MRVFHAKKSKVGKKIRCASCNAKIKPGESYSFIWRRYSRRSRGVKITKCYRHRFRPSELTSSKMGEVYDAQLDAGNTIRDASDPSEIEMALRDVISAAESVKEQYEESKSNMPEPLQEGPTGEQIQEKVDALESYISELETAADNAGTAIIDADEGTQEYDDELTELIESAESALSDLSV